MQQGVQGSWRKNSPVTSQYHYFIVGIRFFFIIAIPFLTENQLWVFIAKIIIFCFIKPEKIVSVTCSSISQTPDGYVCRWLWFKFYFQKFSNSELLHCTWGQNKLGSLSRLGCNSFSWCLIFIMTLKAKRSTYFSPIWFLFSNFSMLVDD